MTNKEKKLKVIKTLRERGERITPAREKIVEIFHENDRPITAAELLAALKKARVPANKTTIYRQLEDLVVHGIVSEVSFQDDVRRFEITAGDHHHHLVCLKCGKVSDVELSGDLAKQEKEIKKKKSFTVLRHALEFFGHCRKCEKI